jgi:hypothetical protein
VKFSPFALHNAALSLGQTHSQLFKTLPPGQDSRPHLHSQCPLDVFATQLLLPLIVAHCSLVKEQSEQAQVVGFCVQYGVQAGLGAVQPPQEQVSALYVLFCS